jgi:glycosyltransferase involved in cell wall biosynthesis
MTQAGPEVSVLCTARNADAYIAEMIDSIRAQTHEDWELVIVDDGSTDGTVAVVEGYIATDPRVRLVRRQASGGPYAAANEGLRHTRGRYIARLDADDVSVPHRLERQLAFLREHPELRACTADVLVYTGGELRPFRVRNIPTLPGSIKWGLCVRGFLPSTALFDGGALDEIGRYRELPVSQDHRVWCDLARRGWLGAMREVLTYWRVHEGQLSDSRLDLQFRLGAEVVRDHLRELGSEWTEEDVFALRSVGHRRVSLRRGISLVRRWQRLWRADDTLTRAERDELAGLARRLQLELSRESFRHLLGTSTVGRAAMRAYTRVHTRGRA